MPLDHSELDTKEGTHIPRRKLAIPVWIWFAVEWFVLLFVFLKTTLWLVDHISGMSAALISAAGFLRMLIFLYGIYAGKHIPTL